jgi:hypothetical protein
MSRIEHPTVPSTQSKFNQLLLVTNKFFEIRMRFEIPSLRPVFNLKSALAVSPITAKGQA